LALSSVLQYGYQRASFILKPDFRFELALSAILKYDFLSPLFKYHYFETELKHYMALYI